MKHVVLIVIVLVFSFTKAAMPPREKTAPPPKEDDCGVERWKVKTLSDIDSSSIDFTKIAPTTVSSQARMPTIKITRDIRQPSENTVLSVTALVTSYKAEDDGDIHIVLQDPSTGETMIAEIPNPHCTNILNTSRADMITKTRDWFIANIGHPTSKFKNTKTMVTITGTSFIDHIHGQRGAAPNGREIHPVLSMQSPDTPITLGAR